MDGLEPPVSRICASKSYAVFSMSDCCRYPVLFPVDWFWKLTDVPPVDTLGRMKLTIANFSEPSGQRFFTSHCVRIGAPPTTA